MKLGIIFQKGDYIAIASSGNMNDQKQNEKHQIKSIQETITSTAGLPPAGFTTIELEEPLK